MAEEIVAQIELDFTRDADNDPAGEELKDSFANGDGDEKPAPGEQLAVGEAAVQVVDDKADEARALNHDSVGAEYRDGSGQQTLPVTLHVGEQGPELGGLQGQSPEKV
jgi:hypothetical protein